jgi:hypothetical protein
MCRNLHAIAIDSRKQKKKKKKEEGKLVDTCRRTLRKAYGIAALAYVCVDGFPGSGLGHFDGQDRDEPLLF